MGNDLKDDQRYKFSTGDRVETVTGGTDREHWVL
jgi:hypothetical protein